MANIFDDNLNTPSQNIFDSPDDVSTENAPPKRVGAGSTTFQPSPIAKFIGKVTGISSIAGALKRTLTEPQPRFGINTDIAKQALGGAVKLGTTIGTFGMGAAPTLGRAVTEGAVAGGLFGTGQGLEEDKGAKDIAKSALTGAATGGALSGATYGLGKLLEKAGTGGLNKLIKPTQKDVNDGFKIETVKKYDLGGTLRQMQDKTQNRINDLISQQKDLIQNSGNPAKINLFKVYDQTAKDIGSQTSKMRGFGSNTRIQSALEQLKNEVGNVNNVGDDFAKYGVDLPDAQLVKQAAGQMGAWMNGKPDPDAIAAEKVYNAFYHNLKNEIERVAPEGLKEVNQRISELIPVSNAILRRIPVAERNAVLSLTDFIGLAAATFEPRALGLTLANMAAKSGWISNGLLKLSQPVLNSASKIGGIGAGFGKTIFSTNQRR